MDFLLYVGITTVMKSNFPFTWRYYTMSCNQVQVENKGCIILVLIIILIDYNEKS